jgi:hypothetical protein
LPLVRIVSGRVAVNLVKDTLHGRVRNGVRDVHKRARLVLLNLLGGLPDQVIELGLAIIN